MAVILTLTMMIIFIPIMTLTASAAEDVTPSTSLSGSGTAAVPFKIASAADLAYMRDQINAKGGTITPSGGGDSVTASTAHYRLTADIVLGYWQDDGDGIVEDGEIYDSASGGTAYSASNWTPIGIYKNRWLSGTFDGGNHTVSGIYININTDESNQNQGLFGILNSGTVKNVGVKDSYIKGKSNVGGIAGYVGNSSGKVKYCYNTGSVSGSSYVGGIAGLNINQGTVEYCYNTGNVSGVNYSVGGILGDNHNGGAKLLYCYNVGSVSGTSYPGGVVGTNNGGTVQNCYYDKQMCPIGGIGGVDSGGSAEGKLTSEMTLDAAFSGWSSGETGTWNFTAGLYPRLTGYVDAGTDYKMDETDAAYVSASPVFLATSDTATTVKYNFTLSTENGVSWSSSDGSVISIVGNNAALKGDGSSTLTASLRGVTKTVTLKVDLTPPTLQSAVRDSDTQITVTLSEPCLNLAKANDGGFTVTKTGTVETFAVSGTAQGADASQVVLTVADMSTAAVKGITVTYTAGANGTITDIAGNPLSTDSTGVVIPPWAPKLGTPVGLLWDTANPAKATWGAVANASSYTVQLYKGGIASGDPLTGITNTYYDLSAVITETGTYTFTVQAIGDGATYSDSDVSSKSPDYSYTSPIKTATVNVTAPAVGAAPQTADQVETATSNADYTVTGIVWNEALTAGDRFKAGQVYTATVTLTSKNGKEFQAAPFNPTVASASSVETTTTAGTGTGNTVTFTVTFGPTAALQVTGIAVTAQPTKLSYTEGTDGILALNGMVVTESNNDGSAAIITFTDGTAAGYTSDPANGTALTKTIHNNKTVTVTHIATGKTAQTHNLTVNVAILTGTATITGDATFGQTLTASLTGGNNTGTLSYQCSGYRRIRIHPGI